MPCFTGSKHWFASTRELKGGKKGGLRDGHLCFLFQRPAVNAFLEVNGDKEKGEIR